MKTGIGPANMRPIARWRRGRRIFAELSFLTEQWKCFGDLDIDHAAAESLALTELIARDARLVRLNGTLAEEYSLRLDKNEPPRFA